MLSTQQSIELSPKPGFTVKTKILQSKIHPVTTKVFINICHDDQVPKPSDFDKETTFQLIIDNQWEIPLVLSKEKSATDKKGVPSLVYDCIINTKCFTWITLNSDLRSIMIEWGIEAVELLYEVTLERDYSIPKMASKGELSKTVIDKEDLQNGLKKLNELKNNEVLGLLEEMKEDSPDQDLEELPSLLSINGKNKVLIQEIDRNEKKDGNGENENVRKDDLKSKETSLVSSDTRNINYNLSFVKLHEKYQLLIKFTANTSLDKLVVEFKAETSSVVISSDEGSFGKDKTLDIPVAGEVDAGRARCFLVKPEKCLYIFV